jgi:hypothetical protein
MPEIDLEFLDRAVRWCAESGRPARAEELRALLEPLSWDALLAVKATLADPPPGRDLSPADLIALSRGAAPASKPSLREPAAPAARATRAKGSRAPRAASAPRIRRARDQVSAGTPGAVPLPFLDGLFRESGRAEIGRLVRRLGANRIAILSDLASRWSAGDGTPPTGPDLDRLLEHHGLTRGFAERERALSSTRSRSTAASRSGWPVNWARRPRTCARRSTGSGSVPPSSRPATPAAGHWSGRLPSPSEPA